LLGPFRNRAAAISDRHGRSAQGREEHVQALHPDVATTGALLGVAERRLHGVVDVEVSELVATRQERGLPAQVAQQAGVNGVELPDVTEGEGPQERPQRRGRPGHR